jgi:hypothetical protein
MAKSQNSGKDQIESKGWQLAKYLCGVLKGGEGVTPSHNHTSFKILNYESNSGNRTLVIKMDDKTAAFQEWEASLNIEQKQLVQKVATAAAEELKRQVSLGAPVEEVLKAQAQSVNQAMKASSQASNQQMKSMLITTGCVVAVGLLVLATVKYMSKDGSTAGPALVDGGDNFDDDWRSAAHGTVEERLVFAREKLEEIKF